MDKLLQLNKLKASSFQELRGTLEGLENSIQEAQKSHLSGASKSTIYDTATAWAAIARSDGYEKGHKSGYSDACGDLLGALNNIKAQVDQYQAGLQELIKDLEDEVVTDTSIDQEASGPLD